MFFERSLKRSASELPQSTYVKQNIIHMRSSSMPRALLLLFVAIMLGGCTAGMLNAMASRDHMDVRTGISYGDGPRHKLDVYSPAGATSAPVVVFFYGGGWTKGDRGTYRFLGAALAERGLVVVVPDYRLYPEIRFPAYMDDAAQAVAWTRAHAAEFGGDPDRIFIMGHSAGGQIAALLALDADYLKAVGLSPHDLSGMIGLSGPYDFLPLTDPIYKDLFGPEDRWWTSQAVSYVTPNAPPIFLATAEKDGTVWPRNTYRLSARLREANDNVEVKVYSSLSHITMIGAFADQLAFIAPVRRDVLAFIAAHPAVSGGTH
jgi:acetyl esterase/lipase